MGIKNEFEKIVQPSIDFAPSADYPTYTRPYKIYLNFFVLEYSLLLRIDMYKKIMRRVRQGRGGGK